MVAMPNVHIREVPVETVETLRAAAERHGRSLNAELVAALVEHADREAVHDDIARRLEDVRRRWRERNPDGFPPGLEPEAIIRRHRDAT